MRFRVKRYILKLTASRQLVFSFRRFKTKKINRSKRYAQFVLPVRFSSYKELSVVYKHKKASQQKGGRLLFKQSQAVALAIILTGLTALIYFGLHISKPRIFLPIATSGYASVQKTTKPSKVLPYSLPVRLRIASIGVNAGLVQLGKNADGSMETPTDIATAGWYKYSPTPGELGPSIITGHVDSYRGAGVFFRLREMQPGDMIEVIRTDGSAAKYQVTKIDIYPKKAFPTSEVYGNIDYAGLRLITCGGAFDRHVYDYDSNIVVYGSLI